MSVVTRDFTEAIDLSEAQFIQGDIPMLKDCKILGDTSQNDRYYTMEAMSAALPLYEDVNVNLNHPPDPHKSRDYQDRFGWLTNVHMKEAADGKRYPYGNLCFNPKHPWAETTLWWAQHRPKALGLSHNAVGQGRDENGKFVVEKIVKVRSVDLVADPATTKTLFEAVNVDKTEVKTAKEDSTPPDPVATGSAPAEKPAEAAKPEEKPAETAGGETIEHKVGHLILQIIKNKSLTAEEKKKRVLAGLKIAHTEAPEEKPEGKSEEKPEEKPEGKSEEKPEGTQEAYESVQPGKDKPDNGPSLVELAESILKSAAAREEVFTLAVDSLKARDSHALAKARARRMCQEAKMPDILISELFLQECAEACDENKVRQLIEDRLLLADVKPAVPPPHAGKRQESAAAVDTKAFVESLTKNVASHAR